MSPTPKAVEVRHPTLSEFNFRVEAWYDPETKMHGVILRQKQSEQTLILNADRREGCIFLALDSFPQLQQALLAMGRASRQLSGPIRIITP